jgi:hypothetical protein
LRVLGEQTLEIILVVKYFTSPGTSNSSNGEERECTIFGFFQQEGVLCEGRKFYLAKEKEI